MSTYRIFNRISISTLLSFAIAACSGQVMKIEEPDTVVARINDLGSRPDWLDETKSVERVGDDIVFLGSATLAGDARIEAGYRIAESNARMMLASSIKNHVERIFQDVEDGAAIDSTQVEYTAAEAVKIALIGVRPARQFWEKLATTTESGARTTRYRIFSLVGMTETQYRNAVIKALREAEGRGGISADLAEKAQRQWQRIENQLTSPQPAEAPPVQPQSQNGTLAQPD